jgi:hypothetical protein
MSINITSRLETQTLTLDTQPIKILHENVRRVGVIIDNRGPGTVYIAPDRQRATPETGFRIPANMYVVDDFPPAHLGEWWAVADTSNTVLVVGEATC